MPTGATVSLQTFCVALLSALCACCSPGTAADHGALFDSARAWRDLEHIVGLGPRPAGSEALEKTRVFIESELSRAGLEPKRETFTADTPLGRFEMANIYADIPATGGSREMLILCTHFDTKRMRFPFVGANDGGSGTAVLLEIARVLARRPDPELGWRILFLDGEEAMREHWESPDHTYGSRHHASGLKQSGAAERVRAAVLLDMVGDRDLRFTRERYSDRRLMDIFFDAARSIDLGAHVDGAAIEVGDDHQSFMAVDIPSIDLIDFEYGPDNSYWHTERDTLEHCSRQSLEHAGRIVLAGLPVVVQSFRRR